MTKTVYQYDRSGLYIGETVADPSPLEPDVWLMPARTTETPPPADVPADKQPRWNGTAWTLANKPQAAENEVPLDKLQAFLLANPDVAAMLNNQGGV